MEDAHPIPKNLMDVEFKLFGSMTLKQFASLVIWLFVALFFYLINLPPIVGYPIIGFNIFMGIAFAFLKVGDQPFPKWLTNFLIAILTPQRKVWRKDNSVPKILQTNFAKPNKNTAPKADKQADALIDEIISKNRPKPIEDYQAQNVEKQKQQIADNKNKDSIIENFKKNNSFKIPEHNQVNMNQPIPTQVNQKSRHEQQKQEQKETSPASQQTKQLEPSPEVASTENTSQTNVSNNLSSPTQVPVKSEVELDKANIQNQKQISGSGLPENTTTTIQNESEDIPQKENQVAIEKKIVSQNNMVSGRVMNAQGSAEPGIDVIILDAKQAPVRTLKANNQGMFKLDTPLEDGLYYVSAKKDGQKFQAIEVDLDGSFEKILTIYEI